ncbi:MAG: UDP-3-O-(3-hydroxymyristoyl)glucosamine N-acyltransferase [Spirochaetes bacterium]|nr:UDP-3-O-(3-hydroxymyristoyl)glucosamine N-acyltransferase [Spirochaetota bacterium]
MKLSRISQLLNEQYHGEDIDIERVGSLEADCKKAILYVENSKYLEKAKARKPAALVIPPGLNTGGIPFIEVEDPKLVFIKLLEIFNPSRNKPDKAYIDKDVKISTEADVKPDVTVMAGAVIMKGVRIGAGSVIYPNCVLEKDCSIGTGTILYSGVIIRERCTVGNDCIIHSGTVVGSDGYGFYEKEGKIIKIPQIGIVEIADRVEIGANCAVDRATVDKTVIGSDTKLDNMVHIAHNVRIGERCLIAAQAGISGSVNIGNHVIILGQAGIADHVSIADNTIILAQSGIPSDVKKAEVLFGTIARPIKEHHRIHAALKYLPDLLKRVKDLESKLEGRTDKY